MKHFQLIKFLSYKRFELLAQVSASLRLALYKLKTKYNIKIDHFSSHSLRKTFGRAVYNNSENNAEFALVKLSELFNHSDVLTTRKYLGLRNDELMETYELLKF